MHIIRLIHNKNAVFLMIISILIFAFINKNIGSHHFYTKEDKDLKWLDFFYYSFSTQSLLGIGDITPRTYISKVILMIQIFITISITFFNTDL